MINSAAHFGNQEIVLSSGKLDCDIIN